MFFRWFTAVLILTWSNLQILTIHTPGYTSLICVKIYCGFDISLRFSIYWNSSFENCNGGTGDMKRNSEWRLNQTTVHENGPMSQHWLTNQATRTRGHNQNHHPVKSMVITRSPRSWPKTLHVTWGYRVLISPRGWTEVASLVTDQNIIFPRSHAWVHEIDRRDRRNFCFLVPSELWGSVKLVKTLVIECVNKG